MTYSVRFTENMDSSKPFNNLKPALVVNDYTVNTDTSVSFVGTNYGAYAPAIAESILGIMENFSNNTPPRNPIEGQLWFNNASRILNVYDGITWIPTGSIVKATTEPSPSKYNAGDLWVDTQNSQLYIMYGDSWILVGPNFSNGSKTGTVVEEMVSTDYQTYSVISFYTNGNRVAIFSDVEFIPNAMIQYFPIIKKGVTMLGETGTVDVTFNGVAETAKSLLVDGVQISPESFIRNDGFAQCTFQNAVAITSSAGLTIGEMGGIVLGIDNDAVVLKSTSPTNTMHLQLTNSDTTTTVLYLDSYGNVGINTINPVATLDVSGGTVSLGSTTITGGLTVDSITTSGELQVSSKLSTSDGITLDLYDADYNRTAGSVLVPGYTTDDSNPPIYDIGSEQSKFRNVYAEAYFGDLTGNVTGDVTGSAGTANSLTNYTQFKIDGDVSCEQQSYNGSQTSLTFTTTLSTTFIESKPTITDVSLDDTLLIYTKSSNSPSLNQITTADLVKPLPVIKVGMIMQYASSSAPPGYLTCDGSIISQTTYKALFDMVGFSFKDRTMLANPDDEFALPDLSLYQIHASIIYYIYTGVE